MKYKSITEFKEDQTYITANGESVLINRITNEPNWNKVSFVLNDSINDIQDHESFLAMMNGKKHSIFDF